MGHRIEPRLKRLERTVVNDDEDRLIELPGIDGTITEREFLEVLRELEAEDKERLESEA